MLLIVAFLATWRLTEILAIDRISASLRTRWGSLFSCTRCVSVWSGIACVVAWHVWAASLYPLALSQLFLFGQSIWSWIAASQSTARELRVGVDADGNVNLMRSDLTATELSALFPKLLIGLRSREQQQVGPRAVHKNG